MEKKDGILKGAFILGLAGILVKVLGAALRLPITNLLGEGMAYYSVSYTVYSVLLVMATAGIPVAISRMVSERIAVKQYRSAHKVFQVAVALMAFIGFISFSAAFFGAETIAIIIKMPGAAMSIKAIAPALFFVPFLSAYRGYMQGRQNMKPTAISEIFEQLTRVIVGLVLAFILVKEGLEAGAAGAAFGASAGSLIGLCTIYLIYKFSTPVIHQQINRNDQYIEETKTIIVKILIIAVPIILGAEIMPIMETVDTSIVMRRLQATGWSLSKAEKLFSQYGGFCNSLIAFPQLFTQAVAVSLVPVVANSFKRHSSQEVSRNIQSSMKFTMVMAFPCAVGIFILAKPVLFMMYPKQPELALGSVITLKVMAIGIVLLAIAQTTTSTLQAIDKQIIPVKHILIGSIAKIAVTYYLVGINEINIVGAAIGSICTYSITAILNCLSIQKYTKTTFNFINTFLKPAAASIFMGITVLFCYNFLNSIFGNSISTLGSIFVGVIIYVILILRSRIIDYKDLSELPFGNKLIRVFHLK